MKQIAALVFYSYCTALFPFLLLPAETADEKENTRVYVGIGVGYGNGSFTDNTGAISFADWNKGMEEVRRMTFNVELGSAITSTLEAGLNISSIINRAKVSSQASGTQAGTLTITNYLASITYFPGNYGFLLHTGAGFSRFTMRTNTPFGGYFNAADGIAGLVGIGYRLRTDGALKVGISFDYSFQKYFGSTEDPSNSRFWNLYCTCFWN